MKIGSIVQLSILWFGKKRYYLVYKITNKDYVLLNITGKGKDEMPQYPLKNNLPGHTEGSFVNLNNLVLVEKNFFAELFIKMDSPKEKLEISEEEFIKISKENKGCFTDKLIRCNLYRVRVLCENDKKSLGIISN